MQPQMLMQLVQTDPRYMHVFQELTGIDLMQMGAESAKAKEQEEADLKKAEEARKKRQAEDEAKAKAAAEEALPAEEKAKIQRVRDAEAKKLEGNQFYKKKDFEKAIELYSAAIELNPDDIIFYSNIAAVYMEMKDFDRAIEYCDEGIERSKGQAYDYVKLAKVIARKASCLFNKGMLDESIDLYKSALLEDNTFAIKDALKKVEKAKKEAEAKAYINPEIAEQHKAKANELFKAGDFPGAIKEFDEAVKRDPSNKTLYTNRALAYIKLMEPMRAKQDAEKALELDPEFVKAWVRKGTVHQLMKEYHKSLEAFEKGLKLDPENKECKDGYAKTMMLIQSTAGAQGGNDQERMQHAMADPEIQAIMRDPTVTQVLRDMQENPMAGQAALKDPQIAAKINKLIAAGVLKVA